MRERQEKRWKRPSAAPPPGRPSNSRLARRWATGLPDPPSRAWVMGLRPPPRPARAGPRLVRLTASCSIATAASRSAVPVACITQISTSTPWRFSISPLAQKTPQVGDSFNNLLVKRNVWRGHLGPLKEGRSREVPLNEVALESLKAHRHFRGPFVFCNAGGTYLKNDACRNAFLRASKRAGLRSVGWHTLRHTFASHLVMRGVPLKTIQALLEHATIEMTMRYAHLSPDVKKDAVRALEGYTEGTRHRTGGISQ